MVGRSCAVSRPYSEIVSYAVRWGALQPAQTRTMQALIGGRAPDWAQTYDEESAGGAVPAGMYVVSAFPNQTWEIHADLECLWELR